jgi:hypothetical protein
MLVKCANPADKQVDRPEKRPAYAQSTASGQNRSRVPGRDRGNLSRKAFASLSRLLNGKAGISADMSLRLSAAFVTHAEIWYELQTDYDLWQASQKQQPKIEPFRRTA